MTFAEICTIIKDICLAIAAATTAIVAVLGMRSWSRELKGKAEFEIARKLIESTYKLRDGVERFRSPFISAGEFTPEYQSKLGDHTAEEEGQAYAKIYGDRWENNISEAIQEFDANSIEAEAFWGGPIKEKTQELRSCVGTLRASVEAVIRDKFSGGMDFNDKDFGKEMRSNISTFGKENPLTQKINNAIDNIVKELRPYLSHS